MIKLTSSVVYDNVFELDNFVIASRFLLLMCVATLYRLYQNKIGDRGVIDMMPGLLKSPSVRVLR